MRAIGLALLTLLALACGGDPAPKPTASERPTASAADENRPPEIQSIQILPSEPSSGDILTLRLKTWDPDGDRLGLTVEWYRNGQSLQRGGDAVLSGEGFRRGDRIEADVLVSDGEHEVAARAPAVRITNQTPRITSVRILPDAPDAGTDLTAIAEASDVDGDSFELEYRWFNNGEPIPGNGASLPAGSFKRGDEVRVAVTASDPYGEGDTLKSGPLRVPNAAPEITSNPADATVGAGRYKYVIRAEDPDRDRPLRYSLVEGPDGMNLDLLSGVITWRVPESAGGSYPVEFVVKDPLGAEARQRYTIELHWETAPADADER